MTKKCYTFAWSQTIVPFVFQASLYYNFIPDHLGPLFCERLINDIIVYNAINATNFISDQLVLLFYIIISATFFTTLVSATIVSDTGFTVIGIVIKKIHHCIPDIPRYASLPPGIIAWCKC